MGEKEKLFKYFVVMTYIITAVIFIMFIISSADDGNMVRITLYYPCLFAPANYTFRIWYLISLVLTAFAVYQTKLLQPNNSKIRPGTIYLIRIIFLVTCALFIVMLLAWKYDYLALYSTVILILLLCVRVICTQLNAEELSGWEKWFIRLPFSILYGWLIYSAVLSFIILLVSIRWKAFGLPVSLWTISAFLVLSVYVVYRSQKNNDIAYCLTVIWAYIGILVKHLNSSGLNGQYPQIIAAVILCTVLLSGNSMVLLFSGDKNR